MKSEAIFWFRRDLRLEDNVGLFNALQENKNVQPIFIFDDYILQKIPKDDPRLTFIYDSLEEINQTLKQFNTSIQIFRGKPKEIFEELIQKNPIQTVYANEDYDPYPVNRDKDIAGLLQSNNIEFRTYKDSVIFSGDEILKQDQTPYHVFSAYKKRFTAKKFSSPTLQ